MAFTLKEMHFAPLHYDRKESFRVVKEKNRIHVISCASFLNHYGISYKEASKTLKPIWDEKWKMILVKVN